ncbi:hypothetical protein PHYSODRAFT_318763 [Phytophthora sojae]|uniref:WLGC domain-containing protein n=1 Tax=Phytophthora sojae (strain P6497) TaxID=1094619 RepID=G5A6F0_PHYSP|nr:hypothetical protein PHYSODRAFT_318763 [Phytophthora sojae]EGZ08905.1 hypothetical protein PHYSODRAFT_318763 [Phytophthora sojae]|eukprot:XP_009535538.1 hypothetical protein PHYSODRAFT_318763 [Phytophthora sojae]
MDTSSYDNGEFWLITDANPHMTLAGAVGLVVVDVCYLIVTLRMLFWRDKLFGSAFSSHPTAFTTSRRGLVSWLSSVVPRYERFRSLYEDLTAYEGKNRKKWNAFSKLIDISMETAMLRQLLQSGSPMSLTYGFAGFLAVNALSCAVNVLTGRFSVLTEVFIDSIFDLSVAVLFPIVVLVYCYYNFDFGREVYLTYLEMLPPGSFEHLARSFASPSKIALFRVNFDCLRISSLLDFVLRISMNLAFCYRFERVLEALAMSDSETLYSVHPQCVVFAHQWMPSDENCPCLIAIDIDIAPKTFDEWMSPIDAYGKVKTLAAAGMLTSLQVINRQLLELPEEVRKCSNLRVIYLMYTSIEHIPSWAIELHHLETLHIEGKYGNSNLFGFQHVPKLGRLILSLMPNMEQLPDMSPLQNLLEFVLLRPNHICCNGFMAPCNLSHVSCQSYPLVNIPAATCLMNIDPFLGSIGTKSEFEKFAPAICQPSPLDSPEYLSFPTKATIEMCGGKPYRQCLLPGNRTGLCYNTRFQVLSCLADDNYIALRRLQIEKGVGPKCDSAEEKWLGCVG